MTNQRPLLRILVCCGARTGNDPFYVSEAGSLGSFLARGGYEIVYGGGNNGLMGAVVNAAAPFGSRIIGYIPTAFAKFDNAEIPGINQETVSDLFRRKEKFLLSSDAGIVLPGGIGTFDEIGELMAANDLQSYADDTLPVKPIIIVNTRGFFDHVLKHLQHCVDIGFMHEEQMRMIHVVETAEQAVALLDRLNAAGPQASAVLKRGAPAFNF
jgi:uncharacterized protein (TIGR00730 family)